MMRRFDARGRAMCEFGLNELCRTPKLGECDLGQNRPPINVA